eukprot:GILJ01007535.1.p1 GENE.GILJ01007535.1~~GILJ01007535.1.p1  ORF type:complete len:332 (-),score=21.62 GILJ01007535.1:174-1079(-)
MIADDVVESRSSQQVKRVRADMQADMLTSERDGNKSRRVITHSDAESESDENRDFCDKCRGEGRLICCDGCPASFHLLCVDLPRVPLGKWFCPKCVTKQIPSDVAIRPVAASPITIAPQPSPSTSPANSSVTFESVKPASGPAVANFNQASVKTRERAARGRKKPKEEDFPYHSPRLGPVYQCNSLPQLWLTFEDTEYDYSSFNTFESPQLVWDPKVLDDATVQNYLREAKYRWPGPRKRFSEENALLILSYRDYNVQIALLSIESEDFWMLPEVAKPLPRMCYEDEGYTQPPPTRSRTRR